MKTILKPNSVVLFQGDSITDCGRKRETPDLQPANAADQQAADPLSNGSLGQGYPAKIAAIWETLCPGSGVKFINRGISGNRVADLLDRYEKDFKSLNPDLVSILIGINDTWRRYDRNDPTSADLFENRYRTLLTRLKQDFPNAIIVMIEPFLLGSIPERNLWREDLDPKIQAVRSLAKELADIYIPMDGIFVRYTVEGTKEADMAADGVHPTPLGHGIIASEWLLGLKAPGKNPITR